jgi:hypothetical protein
MIISKAKGANSRAKAFKKQMANLQGLAISWPMQDFINMFFHLQNVVKP